MTYYQQRRPSPVTIIRRRLRRDVAIAPSAVPGQEQEGPKSPDSPKSSPSSIGSESSDSDSDSDDEEAQKKKDEKKQQQKTATTSSAPAASTSASSGPIQTIGPTPTAASSQIPLASLLSSMMSSANTSSIPQITGTTLSKLPRPTITSTVTEIKSQTERKGQSTQTSTPAAPPPSLSTGQTAPESFPQQTMPQQEQEPRPIMTSEARVAAIVLGILGALALLICVVVLMKRRKRKDRENHVSRGPDAFNPSNTNSAMAPEVNIPDTAHTGAASSVFARLQGGTSGGGDGHITRSTDRSNTLFGAGTYARPETVSTNRSMSRIPPQTPNPFADPPLNKAYDVLNNRPRSTTLTDRGSWMNNPFKNPESERFDPFGELKDKARRERIRYLQEAKREAELQKQMEQKEAMGLRPDGMPLDGHSGYR